MNEVGKTYCYICGKEQEIIHSENVSGGFNHSCSKCKNILFIGLVTDKSCSECKQANN